MQALGHARFSVTMEMMRLDWILASRCRSTAGPLRGGYGVTHGRS